MLAVAEVAADFADEKVTWTGGQDFGCANVPWHATTCFWNRTLRPLCCGTLAAYIYHILIGISTSFRLSLIANPYFGILMAPFCPSGIVVPSYVIGTWTFFRPSRHEMPYFWIAIWRSFRPSWTIVMPYFEIELMPVCTSGTMTAYFLIGIWMLGCRPWIVWHFQSRREHWSGPWIVICFVVDASRFPQCRYWKQHRC